MVPLFNKAAPAIGLLLLVSLCATPVMAAKSAVERIDIIERKLDSRGLVELLNRIDELQQSLQEMRGEMEVQTHTIEKLQQQQRQQYLDIDQRIRQLDRAPASAAPAAPSVARPTVSAPHVARPPVTAAPPSRPNVSMPQASLPSPAAGNSAPRPSPASPAPKYPAGQSKPVEHVPGSIEQVGEEMEYDAALTALKNGQYPEAVEGFSKFISDHPGSTYADNAHYWLGEAYYVTRDFDRAYRVFNDLVNTFPQSNKVTGSRLKIGYIHYENKNWPAARAELTGVIIDYPDTTVARQAKERLERMKKEGH